MHNLATILTAPSPITPNNYSTKLYAWGDEIHLSEPPIGKAFSCWAHFVGYDRARLDANLRRIGAKLERELHQQKSACLQYHKDAMRLFSGKMRRLPHQNS